MRQSVIVSTYNKPKHLACVLEGLAHQTASDYEVIVADDGSGPETAELVGRFAKSAPFRVVHAWQEDDGFRAAQVRNLGVRESSGEQIVFLDGDCIPFPDFLSAHAASAKPQTVLAGDRLFLDREPTDGLTPDDVSSGRYQQVLPRSEYKQLRYRALKDKVYRTTRLKDRPKVVTANVSVLREDFEAINGLDQRFVGWGHEDEDLRRRLVAVGCRIESVATSALVCHLWHRHVDSFHGKVKYGNNVPYYSRGFFLPRCRHGLVEREMNDLDIAWNQTRSRPAEVAVAWETPSSRPRRTPAAVNILVTDRVPSRVHDPFIVVTATPPASIEADQVFKASDKAPALFYTGALPDLDSEPGRAELLRRLDPIL